MWHTEIPLLEFVVRGAIVYVLVLVLLRLTGKRQVGQLAPFDLVLLLLLSNSVQNAMNGGDNSVLGGAISAMTLIGVNFFVSVATFRNKKIAALVEGRPQILIHDGKVDEAVMRAAQMTHHELDAALRQSGCASPEQVRFALLENNGQISVVPRKTS
jgi:uncharacterized membrane protein YcaP (DUF421 family)